MPQYSKLQLVAYEVLTGMPTDPGNIVAPPTAGGADPLLDVRGLSNADARSRLSRFYQVIEHTRTAGAAKLGGADTLKVCIAPEFYFRDNTPDSYADETVVNNVFAALLAMFRQANYKDWLFIPGSIFWHKQTPAPTPASASATKPAYFNTVCVVRGRSADFPADAPAASGIPVVKNGTTNQKALMSHVDHPEGDKRNFDGAINDYFQPVIGDWNYKKGHVFEVQDIQGPKGKPLVFGLEVCLEHAMHMVGLTRTAGGALKEALAEWSANEKSPVPVIDVQLLTSCGMDVEAENVCARAGGYILKCDGSTAYPTFSRAVPVTGNDGRAAVLGTNVAEAVHVDVPAPLQLPSCGNQTVRIYDAVALPG